ncbi:MAG: hypothetical protein SGI74_12915 [Oligoflexia bacterium]|nr:hypothetical protein [Oligoflexia bacterium]
MNEAAPLLMEYNMRLQLSKLGYRFDGQSLSSFKAQAFTIISSEISRLEAESLKKR